MPQDRIVNFPSWWLDSFSARLGSLFQQRTKRSLYSERRPFRVLFILRAL